MATYGVAVVGQHSPAAVRIAAHAIVLLSAAAAVTWLRSAPVETYNVPTSTRRPPGPWSFSLQAMQPSYALLEIHAIQWVTSSGQRVWAVDVLTGGISDRWVLGSGWPVGALILMSHRPGQPPDVTAAMTPTALQAANRHRHAAVSGRVPPGLMVIQAAERLLNER
ncbi:MAG TPA: hypothetical protein VF635_16790 [Propionibacteriaceae bacterium]